MKRNLSVGNFQKYLLVAITAMVVCFSQFGVLISSNNNLVYGQESDEGSSSNITEEQTQPQNATQDVKEGVEKAEVMEVALPTDPVKQQIEKYQLDNGVNVLLQSIPGIKHTAVVVTLKTGDDYDPSAYPGLNHMLERLAFSCATDKEPGRTYAQIDSLYPVGWITQTYHDHTAFGIIVKSDEAALQTELLADRLRTLKITANDINIVCDNLQSEIKERFENQRLMVPMSWLVGKSFRHSSGNVRGCDPDKLARLSPENLQKEWQARTDPSNISVVVCGFPITDELAATVDLAFGKFSSHDNLKPPTQITVKPAGAVNREVIAEHLPGDRDHVGITFYAPLITSPDHPAFLAVARNYMSRASDYPEAKGRLTFQYELLSDPRAAYLTPHAIGFPEGPQQAIDLWNKRLENKQSANLYGKRAYRAVGYQLGGDLSVELVTAMRNKPSIIYTIAYATAFRNLYGDDTFWSNYRDALLKLDKDTIEAARTKYFLSEDNRATFILKSGN